MNDIKGNASKSISKALGIIDHAIKSGSAPGSWPGECPLREGCAHVKPRKRFFALPCHMGMAAVLVLILSVGLSESVGSYVPGEVRKVGETSGKQGIYQDEFTGDRFVHFDGDSVGAVVASEVMCGPRELHSVVCWTIEGDSYCVARSTRPGSSLLFSESVQLKTSGMNASLAKFWSSGEVDEAERRVLSSGVLPYGNEVIEINGTPLEFQKWKIKTSQGVADFMYADSSHQYSLEH